MGVAGGLGPGFVAEGENLGGRCMGFFPCFSSDSSSMEPAMLSSLKDRMEEILLLLRKTPMELASIPDSLSSNWASIAMGSESKLPPEEG